MRRIAIGGAAIAVALAVAGQAGSSATAQTTQSYDTTTLAGKVASVRGTAGLQLRMSAFLEEEAEPTSPADVLGPDGVTLIEPGGGSVQPPDVTVNRDTAAAPQNETAIAVDPNRPGRVVSAANDYVTRIWSCTVGGTPCSALGDAYSGTYYSNDGGQTWCCASRDPQHLGTLIPGVTRLAGGQYDAGGDQPVPRPGVRDVDALPVQREQRQLRPVPDPRSALQQRRSHLQHPEGHLRQRPLLPGLAGVHRAGRHGVRDLGGCHPAVHPRRHLDGEVDRRW